MLYSWPGVRKCWLSMLSNVNKCCVIDSPLTNNFLLVKEVIVQYHRKCLRNIKSIKLFSREEGLLKIRPNQHRGTRVVNCIWLKMSYNIFFLLNHWNTNLFSHQGKTVEILIARYRSCFDNKKKLHELMQDELVFKTYQCFMVNW